MAPRCICDVLDRLAGGEGWEDFLGWNQDLLRAILGVAGPPEG